MTGGRIDFIKYRVLFLATALVFAAAGAVSALLWVRRRWVAPLNRVSIVAERLAAGDEAARADASPHDAVGRLAATINLLAETFQHDLSELRRLEQVRKDFVANVSHELRTPLASVKAFAETLRSGAWKDAANRDEFLQEIEQNADRMTRLVEDLLTISALESGRMPPRFEPLSLLPVAAEAAASLKPLAGKKRIVLRVEPFGDLPQVRADRGQLKQVLSNLIDNAIKYTPENGTIRLSAAAQAGWVTVSVQDNGVGIPPEDQPRVFERFYRVDKARSREEGGTGLGLSIVKHIVEVHGGRVSLESAQGQGSTFRFSLPALG